LWKPALVNRKSATTVLLLGSESIPVSPSQSEEIITGRLMLYQRTTAAKGEL